MYMDICKILIGTASVKFYLKVFFQLIKAKVRISAIRLKQDCAKTPKIIIIHLQIYSDGLDSFKMLTHFTGN